MFVRQRKIFCFILSICMLLSTLVSPGITYAADGNGGGSSGIVESISVENITAGEGRGDTYVGDTLRVTVTEAAEADPMPGNVAVFCGGVKLTLEKSVSGPGIFAGTVKVVSEVTGAAQPQIQVIPGDTLTFTYRTLAGEDIYSNEITVASQEEGSGEAGGDVNPLSNPNAGGQNLTSVAVAFVNPIFIGDNKLVVWFDNPEDVDLMAAREHLKATVTDSGTVLNTSDVEFSGYFDGVVTKSAIQFDCPQNERLNLSYGEHDVSVYCDDVKFTAGIVEVVTRLEIEPASVSRDEYRSGVSLLLDSGDFIGEDRSYNWNAFTGLRAEIRNEAAGESLEERVDIISTEGALTLKIPVNMDEASRKQVRVFDTENLNYKNDYKILAIGEFAVTSPDTGDYIYGTLKNSDSSMAAGGTIAIRKKGDDGWNTPDLTVGSKGDFIVSKSVLAGSGKYIFTALPLENSEDAPVIQEFDYDENNPSARFITLQLNETQVHGTVYEGEGTSAVPSKAVIRVRSGFNQEDFFMEYPVRADGSFNVGGLVSGKNYYYQADCEYESDFIYSKWQEINESNTNVQLHLRAAQICAMAYDINGVAKLRGEQYSVDVLRLQGSGEGDWTYKQREDGRFIIAGLETGTYAISIRSNEGIAKTRSFAKIVYVGDEGNITDEDGNSLQAFPMELTEPQRRGRVVLPGDTPSEHTFDKAYVEVFSEKNGRPGQYLGWFTVDDTGAFNLGGLLNGTYFIRAGIWDSQEYSGSMYKEITLDGSSSYQEIELEMLDKSPRVTCTYDVNMGSDSFYFRIKNASGVDLSKLKVKLLNGQEDINADYVEFDEATWDHEGDEVSIKAYVTDGIKLGAGEYRLQVTYDNTDVKYDYPGLQYIRTIYSLFTFPWELVPSETAGTDIMLWLNETEEWRNDDQVNMVDQNGAGHLLTVVERSNDENDRWVKVRLPELNGLGYREGSLRIEVIREGIIIAHGDLNLTIPQITGIWTINSEDLNIGIEGRGLSILKDKGVIAEVYSGEQMVDSLEQAEMGENGTLLYKLNKLLVPGKYILKLRQNSGHIEIGSQEFLVAPKLTPHRLLLAPASGQTLILSRTSDNVVFRWDGDTRLSGEIWGEGIDNHWLTAENFTTDGTVITVTLPELPTGEKTICIYDENTGVRLGYTKFDVGDGSSYVIGTLKNFDGTPASGGTVYVRNKNNDNWGRKIEAAADGSFILSKADMNEGDNYVFTAIPPENSEDAPATVEYKIAQGALLMKFNDTQVHGVVRKGSGYAQNCVVRVSDFKEEGLWLELPVRSDGTFNVGGLNPDKTYYYQAEPRESVDYVLSPWQDAQPGDFVDKTLTLRPVQVRGIAHDVSGEKLADNKYCIDVIQLQGQESDFCTKTLNNGRFVAGGLEPGMYTISIRPSDDISRSRSYDEFIQVDENGVATPSDISVYFSKPQLYGNISVQNGTSNQYERAYVQIFLKDKSSGTIGNYIGMAPTDGAGGNFSIGGLYPGSYYIRAKLNNDPVYYTSAMHEINVGDTTTTPSTITLALLDRAPRVSFIQGAYVGSELSFRMMNAQGLDPNKLSVEIVSPQGGQSMILSGRENISISDSWGEDNEVDVRAATEGGIKLPAGDYKLKVSYDGNIIPYDYENTDSFKLVSGLIIDPGEIRPSKAAQAEVSLYQGNFWDVDIPAAWNGDTVLTVKMYDVAGEAHTLASAIKYNSQAQTYYIEVKLPLESDMPGGKYEESGYRLEVYDEGGQLMARGDMGIVQPTIENVWTVNDEAMNIVYEGKALSILKSEGAHIQVYEDGVRVTASSKINDEKQDVLEFELDRALKQGEYTLKLLFDSNGDGTDEVIEKSLSVVPMLKTRPAYVLKGEALRTVMLELKTDGAPTWNPGEILDVWLKDWQHPDIHIDDKDVTVGAEGISVRLPADLLVQNYWIEIVRKNDGKLLGNARLDVYENAQLKMHVIDQFGQELPYSAILVLTSNFDFIEDFPVDKEGNAIIYGLEDGDYRIVAHQSGKYIDSLVDKLIIQGNKSTLVRYSGEIISGSDIEAPIDFTVSKTNSIKGTISMPGTEVAPPGGFKLEMYAMEDREESTPNDPVGFTAQVTIPAGQHSTEYEIMVPQDERGKDYILSYWTAGEGSHYIARGYYSTNGTVFALNAATPLSSRHSDVTNLNFSVKRGMNIAGTVYLSDAVTLPEELSEYPQILVKVCKPGNTSDSKDDIQFKYLINFEKGENSRSYLITVPALEGYVVSYTILNENDSYEGLGYFSEAGTVADVDHATCLDLTENDAEAINLYVAQAQAPVCESAEITPDGSHITISFNKPLDSISNLLQGHFTVKTGDYTYGLDAERLEANAGRTTLTFPLEGYSIYNNETSIRLEYDGEGGIKSANGIKADAFSIDVNNNSTRQLTITCEADGQAAEDRTVAAGVTLMAAVTGAGITVPDMSFSVNGVEGFASDEDHDGRLWYVFETSGTYDVIIKIADLPVERHICFTIDREAPKAPEISIAPKAPTNGDVTVTITYFDGSSVKRYQIDDENIKTSTEAAVTFLLEHNAVVTAYAADEAGNTTSSSITIFNIDKDPPVITIKPYNTDLTNKPVTVYAEVTSGDAINAASYKFTSNGSFTFEATDAAGNKTTKTVAVTNVDTTPPAITITGIDSVANSTVVLSSDAFEWDDSAAETRTLTLNGKTVTTGTAIKAPGEYTLTASARDAAGNSGSATVTFTVSWDMTAPVINVANVTQGAVYTTAVSPSITLTGGSNLGNYSHTAKLRRPDGSIEDFTEGTSMSTAGSYRLEVTALNPSYTHMVSTKTLEFTIDKAAPVTAVSGAVNGTIYNTAVTPVVTFSDDAASQQLLTSSAAITLSRNGTAVAYRPGDTLAEDGVYVLTAVTSDGAARNSNTVTLSFTIDRSKPVLQIWGALNGYTYKDTNVTFSAVTNEGTLTVTSNETPVTLTGNQYVFTGEAGKSVNYRLVIKAVDAAGNAAEQQLTFTIDRLAVNILVSGVTEGQLINYAPDISYTTYEGDTEQPGTTAKIDGASFDGGKYGTEGKHVMVVSYISGSVTYTKTISFTIDKTSPVAASVSVMKNGTAVSGNLVAKTGDIIKVQTTVTDAAGIDEVYFTMAGVVAKVPMKLNGSYYEGEFKVEGGNYSDASLVVYARDRAGNSVNTAYGKKISIDNTRPSVSVATNPVNADGTSGIYKSTDLILIIAAGTTDTITYYLNGTSGTAIGTKVFVTGQTSETIRQGTNSLICYAQDEAGNKSDEKVLVFEYDSIKPANVVLNSTAAGGKTNVGTFSIKGSVANEGGKPGSYVVLKKKGNIVQKANINTDSTFEINAAKLAEGVNNFTLTAVDRAGNNSDVTVISRELDSIAPVVIVDKETGAQDDVFINYTVIVNETLASDIIAKFNDVSVNPKNISKETGKQYTVRIPKGDQVNGANTLKVFATDTAGNTGNGSCTDMYIQAEGQNDVPLTDTATVDIPSDSFSNTVQMLVKTVNIQQDIDYKPIGAPISFEFNDVNGKVEPSQALVIKNFIGAGLTGVMLMHIDSTTVTSIDVSYKTSDIFNMNDQSTIAAMADPGAVYISDTGYLVIKTNKFSAYQVAQDDTDPVIAVSSQSDKQRLNSYDFADGKFAFSGSLTDNDPSVRVSEVTVDNVPISLAGQTTGAQFRTALDLTDGTHEVTLTARDAAGNTSSITKTYIVDRTAPALTATSPVELTNRNTVDITINVSENSEIIINGTSMGWFDRTAVIPVGLDEGVNRLQVTAADGAGNSSQVAVPAITLDSAAPVINISGVSDRDVYGGTVSISVTASDKVSGAVTPTITMDGTTYIPEGSYSTQGQHTLVVTALDAAGNLAAKEVIFTIDTSVPIISVSGAANNGIYSDGKTVTITTANADELIVTKSVDGGAATNVTVSGMKATAKLEVSDGEQHLYAIRITAKKNNPARFATTTLSFSIDKKVPVLKNSTVSNTEQATVTLTGSVDELSDIYLNNVLVIAGKQPGAFTINGQTLAMGENSFAVKAIDTAGNESAILKITVFRMEPAVNDNQGGGGFFGGGFSPVEEKKEPQAAIAIDGSTIRQKPLVKGRDARTTVASGDIGEAMNNTKKDSFGIKAIQLKIEETDGADSYTQELPSSYMLNGTKFQRFSIQTPKGDIVIPGNMFNAKEIKNTANVAISIGFADTKGIMNNVRVQIGKRPIVELTAERDGKAFSWNNPNAPVTVRIKYRPTVEEAKNPDNIVVYCITGAGTAELVPNARFDDESSTITFRVTHFSRYAVAYVKKTFKDIDKSYAKAKIEVVAAKGIMSGTTADKFNPSGKVTRGEFISFLIDSLGLDSAGTDNFTDVKSTDSYCKAVGIAKRLGITKGTGNNKFNPKGLISREDMAVLTLKAMLLAEKALAQGTSMDLSKYKDLAKVNKNAVNSIASLVKEKVMTIRTADTIEPKGNVTREEVADLIYQVCKWQFPVSTADGQETRM